MNQSPGRERDLSGRGMWPTRYTLHIDKHGGQAWFGVFLIDDYKNYRGFKFLLYYFYRVLYSTLSS